VTGPQTTFLVTVERPGADSVRVSIGCEDVATAFLHWVGPFTKGTATMEEVIVSHLPPRSPYEMKLAADLVRAFDAAQPKA
jgi:hypothetical protein